MRVLTGIQPTNILHIGNYFGALKPAVELQTEDELFIGVVDLHAITVPKPPAELKSNIAFATAAYLAAGIDPNKAVLFQQSRIPAHAELCWLLQTVARMGEVERMTQFKDKSKAKGQNVSVGLFTYPVLMAADILLYDIQAVPIGEDQKQHLELTRDLAERFNRDYGNTFVVPKPIINIAGGRILALDNPAIKMSKSAASPKNYISLTDEPDVIRKKLKSAVTDSESGIRVDSGRPGLKNLLAIFELVTGDSMEEIAARYESQGMSALKTDLSEAIISYLTPIQTAIKGYLEHPDELEKIIQNGSHKANAIASKKIAEIKLKMGLSL